MKQTELAGILPEALTYGGNSAARIHLTSWHLQVGGKNPIGVAPPHEQKWYGRRGTINQGFCTTYGLKLSFTEENYNQFIRDWFVSFLGAQPPRRIICQRRDKMPDHQGSFFRMSGTQKKKIRI